MRRELHPAVFGDREPKPEPRPSNPRLRAPIQQIVTLIPVDFVGRYRWHHNDGTAGSWHPARPGKVYWPLTARLIEVEPTENVSRVTGV